MPDTKYGEHWFKVGEDWWLHRTPDAKKSSRMCLVKSGTKIRIGKFKGTWAPVQLETGEEGYITNKASIY